MLLPRDVLYLIFSLISNSIDAWNIPKTCKWWRNVFRSFIKEYPDRIYTLNLRALEDLPQYPHLLPQYKLGSTIKVQNYKLAQRIESFILKSIPKDYDIKDISVGWSKPRVYVFITTSKMAYGWSLNILNKQLTCPNQPTSMINLMLSPIICESLNRFSRYKTIKIII